MTDDRIRKIPAPVPPACQHPDPLEERALSTQTLLDGRFIKILEDQVALPDERISHRVYLTHPGAAAIVALFDDGSILLERQWRHALRQSFWELPAGKLDPNEAPLVCAQRELHEECGVTAQRWQHLGALHNAIGYSQERIEVYLAQDLTIGEQALDDGEFLEVVRVDLEEVFNMCDDGRITDVKTIVAMFWMKRLIEKGQLQRSHATP